MDAKRLHGLRVLDISHGEVVGTIARTYLDAPRKKIVGFAYTASGGFMQVESEPKIDANEIHTLGPDALTIDTVDGPSGIRINEQFGQLLVLEELNNRPVITERGVALGQIASVEFDNSSLALTGIEISPGYFKNNQSVSIQDVTTIGPDYVVVSESAGLLSDSTKGT